MAPASLLMPYFALQLPFWVREHYALAFGAKSLRLLQYPRITQRVLLRTDRAVSNVFGEVLCVREDASFRSLRE